MMINLKFKKVFPKKSYLAFFAVVPLMTLLSVISILCPVCEGKGYISSIGMGDVIVSHLDYSLKSVSSRDACLAYRIYTYDVIMTVENNSTSRNAAGYIKMVLVDYTVNNVLDSRVTEIVIPAGSEVTKLLTVEFGLPLDSPETTKIQAEPVYTKLPCQTCGGTGRVSLNSWPLVNLMKNRMTNAQSISILPVVPFVQEEISEFDVGQQYNTDQWSVLNPDEQ